ENVHFHAGKQRIEPRAGAVMCPHHPRSPGGAHGEQVLHRGLVPDVVLSDERELLAQGPLIHVGGRSVIATTSRAMSCMACNPDVKLFGLRLESRVALVASVSASGYSVHGCRTSFGFSSLMISPDLPVRPSVANPLM